MQISNCCVRPWFCKGLHRCLPLSALPWQNAEHLSSCRYTMVQECSVFIANSVKVELYIETQSGINFSCP